MTKFKSFLDVKKLFKFSIPKLINETMLELSNEIIELNQVEQLGEVIDALDQRIKTISAEEHNNGEVFSTKGRRPLKLVYYSAFLNEKDSIASEKYFKTTRGKQRIRKMLENYLKIARGNHKA